MRDSRSGSGGERNARRSAGIGEGGDARLRRCHPGLVRRFVRPMVRCRRRCRKRVDLRGHARPRRSPVSGRGLLVRSVHTLLRSRILPHPGLELRDADRGRRRRRAVRAGRPLPGPSSGDRPRGCRSGNRGGDPRAHLHAQRRRRDSRDGPPNVARRDLRAARRRRGRSTPVRRKAGRSDPGGLSCRTRRPVPTRVGIGHGGSDPRRPARATDALAIVFRWRPASSLRGAPCSCGVRRWDFSSAWPGGMP